MLMAFSFLAGGIGVAIALNSIDPSFGRWTKQKRLNLPVAAILMPLRSRAAIFSCRTRRPSRGLSRW